jgi:hypothetical protein
MSPKPPPPGDRDSDEISLVVKAPREADLRLEELTSREVDTVSDRDGRSVSTIINLAHSMKLNVVAEGVETENNRGSCACSIATGSRAIGSAVPFQAMSSRQSTWARRFSASNRAQALVCSDHKSKPFTDIRDLRGLVTQQLRKFIGRERSFEIKTL